IKERKIYTLEESANILNLSRSTMLKLIKLGELPVAKIGKQYRILGIFLLRYISNIVNKYGDIDYPWKLALKIIIKKPRILIYLKRYLIDSKLKLK
ncbi:unnamed protein product, partial [marine sediment metagenome]